MVPVSQQLYRRYKKRPQCIKMQAAGFPFSAWPAWYPAGVGYSRVISVRIGTAAAIVTAAIIARFVHSFVYFEHAAIDFLTIGAANRCHGLGIGAHFDKAKAFRAAGIAVSDNSH
jgi:hypothetical protein